MAALLLLTSLPALASAYSWNFKAPPAQCQNVTVSITGSDGKPPYRILIVPIGPTPLPNNVEVRKILDVPFPNNDSNISFKLAYPNNSQFVAVVSDSTGFGSGGTSVVATVTSDSDSSCFDPTAMVSPAFFFSIEPPNQIVQCSDSRVWWDQNTVQGTPNFLGVIPGGQSFSVPQGQITNVSGQGTGFTWKPSIRGGTTVILIGGDNRGNGTGGSFFNVVSTGINNDVSCLNSNSPSSTPGSPAGGSYPTGTTGSDNNNNNESGTNTGAVVGGVLGGLAAIIALILLIWFFRRQKKRQRWSKERPVDLLNAEDDEGEGHQPTQLPEYYQPEPFTVPDPSLPRSSVDGRTHIEDYESRRPLSGASTSFYTRTGTPDLLTGTASSFGAAYHQPGASASSMGTSRKGAPPRQMRPVNIIQHDDGGAVEENRDGEAETIELPPAYHNVRSQASLSSPPPATSNT